MMPLASSRRRLRRVVGVGAFEWFVALAAAVYAALHLSPSSYALALKLLGEDAAPWLGTPQPARSDEWAVGTPLVQAAVNNDFATVNLTSFYNETLRGTGALPLWDWGLVFKPQLWPFLVLPPSTAYSIFWALMAAAMLIGWSLLLRSLGFSRAIAAVTSTLLFFSPFVQAWWTGIGPQLALFPLVALVVVAVRSAVRMAVGIALAVPVWLLAQFYVPGIPALGYVALALVAVFAPNLFVSGRLLALLAGVATGVGITLLYFRPVLGAFANSAYPGNRWFSDGDLSAFQVLSQLLPATTTEGHTSLLAMNISEVSTVASWLPLLTFVLIDFVAVRDSLRAGDPRVRRDVGCVAGLLAACIPITLWQLTSLVSFVGVVFGFGLGPGQRTLFASGTLLLIAGAYALDRLPLRVSVLRLATFSLGVFAVWLMASRRYPGRDVQIWDELLVLVPLAILVPLAWHRGGAVSAHRRFWPLAVGLVALAPTVWVWALFNPLQSTRVMFRKPDTPVTRELDALAVRRSDHAIAVDGFPGAILNGVGYRSVTHVLTVPSPELFRRWFPRMPEARFERLFNRYARVGLTDASQPQLPQADTLLLPKGTMAKVATVDDEFDP